MHTYTHDYRAIRSFAMNTEIYFFTCETIYGIVNIQIGFSSGRVYVYVFLFSSDVVHEIYLKFCSIQKCVLQSRSPEKNNRKKAV